MRKNVLTEAAVVGGTLVAVSYLIMYAARKAGFEGKVPPPAWIFFGVAATHLAWESTGGSQPVAVNARFCRS